MQDIQSPQTNKQTNKKNQRALGTRLCEINVAILCYKIAIWKSLGSRVESRKVEVTLTTLVEKKVEKRDKVPEIIDSGPMCTLFPQIVSALE